MPSAVHPDAEDQPRLYDDLIKAGQLEAALEVARAIQAATPHRPAAHARVGQVLLRLEREDEAWAVLNDAARRLRAHPSVLALLGQIAQRREFFAEAAGFFTRVVALEPENAAYRVRLAENLTRAGDLPGAIKAQQEAVRLAPGHLPFGKQLAALMAKAEEAAAAPPPVAAPPRKTALAGADGYYFHEVDAAFPQICLGYGADDEIRRLLTLWETRHGWCSARGIDYRILIVPEKHAIYADKLPPDWRLDENRAARRLLAWLDPPMRDAVLYPLAEIQAGRAMREVCFRQDVHWTSYGAFLAYRRLIAGLPGLAADMLAEAELGFTIRRAVGDIALWLDMRQREAVEVAVPPRVVQREVFSTKTFATGQVDVIETDHPGGKRLVLFRTSNSTALMPLLARHFSRIVAVASTAMMFDLVRSEQPDVVISELPERYLAVPWGPLVGGRIRVPRDLEPDMFREITGCELPLPPGSGQGSSGQS